MPETPPPAESSYSEATFEKVEARFDLVFAAGLSDNRRFIALQGMEPVSLSYTRNPASIADEWSAVLPYEYLPFDLGVLQDSDAQAIMWISPQGSGKYDLNHPGVFNGIVDHVSRVDQGHITLTGRDLSGILMDVQLTSHQLDNVIKVIRVRKTLKSAVLAIIEEAFAGRRDTIGDTGRFGATSAAKADQWRVRDETDGRLLGGNLVTALGKKSGRDRFRPPTLDESMELYTESSGAADSVRHVTELSYEPNGAGFFTKLVAGKTIAKDNWDPGMRVGMNLVPHPLRDNLYDLETREILNDPTPALARKALQARHDTSRKQTVNGPLVKERDYPYKLVAHHIWPGGRSTTAWDAIYRVCVLMGAIPEVVALADGDEQGHPTVVLLDSEALQTSTDIRKFSRMLNGKVVRHRGLSRNLSIFDLTEELDISPDDEKPSYVNLVSVLPSGQRIFASFGAADSKLVGSLQAISGIASKQVLQRIAKSVWLDMRKSRAIYSGQVRQTFTDGGTPGGADLLQMRYGSAMSIDFGFERDSIESLEDYLGLMGIPAGEVGPLAASLRSAARLPLMQVQDLTVNYDQGTFSAEITMRRLIDPEQYVSSVPHKDEPFAKAE